jgi:hypothetical protein
MSIKKVFAALAFLVAVTSPSSVLATDAGANCGVARAECYEAWYIPNWGCENLYSDCMEKAKREQYTPEP